MKQLLEGNIWRVILTIGALFIGWQIITINLADHYIDELTINKDETALDSALFWDSGHPLALAIKAERLIELGENEQAERILKQAVKGNPADARPLVLLAGIYKSRGEIEISDQMAETANVLMPVNYQVQKSLAAYWESRSNFEKAIAHLSTALAANRELREELYPIFLKIAENQDTRSLLAPITSEPPEWWEGFFRYATRNTEDIDTLRSLAGMRKDSETYPVTEHERRDYIARFRKEELIAEAYMAWVGGLDKDAREALGYIYNGNFERDIANTGFGWYAYPPKNSGIIISTAKTYGIEGEKALYISFKGKRVHFHDLYQHLFLDHGTYRLSGKVRLDKLKARKGLQWQVVCSAGAEGRLGESEKFLGSGDWRKFEFELVVPIECKGQILQLYSVGNRSVDYEIRGEIWFDDLHIQLTRQIAEPEVDEQVE